MRFYFFALIFYILLGLSDTLQSQVPQAFNFQSLVLNEEGEPIPNQEIGIQIEILDADITGDILYAETHSESTNSAGVYTIAIGGGNILAGDFQSISWLDGNKYIALYHDVTGGSNYQLVGANQLLSVPYALASGVSQVEPLIYVAENLIEVDNTLDVSESNPRLNIAYLYRWIQGIPEDVFIEYSGLPDNTYIESYYDPDKQQAILSNLDTIYGGQIPKVARLRISDATLPTPVGDYLINLIFRTESGTTLGTLDYPIRVINTITEVCYDNLIGNLELISTDCEELTPAEGSESELIQNNANQLELTNFINLGESITIEVFDIETCDAIAEVGGLILNDSTEIENIEIQLSEEQIEFFLELFIEPSNETDPPFTKSCQVIYR